MDQFCFAAMGRRASALPKRLEDMDTWGTQVLAILNFLGDYGRPKPWEMFRTCLRNYDNNPSRVRGDEQDVNTTFMFVEDRRARNYVLWFGKPNSYATTSRDLKQKYR